MYEYLGKLSVPKEQRNYIKAIHPNLTDGPWIAGGAVRSWLQGKPVQTDVDVYFKDQKQLESMHDQLRAKMFYDRIRTENAITLSPNTVSSFTSYVLDITNNFQCIKDRSLTFTDKSKVQVQLIKRYFDSPEDILNSYDFAQCQLYTDGIDVYGNPKWNNEYLEIVNFKEDTILKRTLKYYSYGFKLKPGTLKQWSKNKNLNYDLMTDKDYV